MPKTATPAGQKALERAEAANRRIQELTAERDKARADRKAAARKAHDEGVTLATLADRLGGISRERVRQLISEDL